MTKSLNIITGVILLLAIYSCQVKGAREKLNGGEEEPLVLKNHTEEKMAVKEFTKWCADESNCLNKAKDISDIRFRCSYLPAEYMAFLELRSEPYDLAKFRKTCENYSEMTYFNLRLELINGTGELLKYKLQSPAQYEDRIRYLSFEMQRDICLVQKGDTLRPGLFQFERIYEVAPFANVMLAFDNKKFNRNKEFTVVYDDQLFEKGFVKFNYKNNQLINLPNISEL